MNATLYKQKAQKQFDEWKQISGVAHHTTRKGTLSFEVDHKNNVFIKDGVVCPESWFQQDIRPLFLLKEAYGGTQDWDLIHDYLRKPAPISNLWKQVSMWTSGLLSTNTDYCATYLSNEPISQFDNEYLRKIAVVNVKKSHGDKNSNMNEICAYADFDKDYLREQLKLCDPTVIVCGYTGSALDIIFDKKIRKSRNDNLFYHMTLNGHDVIVLDYWHPSNHYPDLMNYYGLMSIYQLALRCQD